MGLRTRPVLLSVLVASCAGQGPEPAPPARVPAQVTTSASSAPLAAPAACDTAACWTDKAHAARAAGQVDVANAHAKRALELSPDKERLLGWVDGLIANGETRRARQALSDARWREIAPGDPALSEQLDQRLKSVREAGESPDLASAADYARAGCEAQAADRPQEAEKAFRRVLASNAGAPHLARAATFLKAHGHSVEASKGWNAARVQLFERQAKLSLVPVETWHTTGIAWVGDHLALLRMVQPIGAPHAPMGQLQLWSVSDPPHPTMSTLFATAVHTMSVTEDGLVILQDEPDGLALRDPRTGLTVQRWPVSERLRAIVSSGSGPERRLLGAAGRETKLWNARGEAVGSFPLAGTTPTIIRAYTGQGAHHDNILRDEKTWPVSLAMSPDGKLVAVGGSDSKIRLFDRATRTHKLLEFKWKYTERRHVGANPDLNTPLAMRFSARGDQLLAVYNHGDVLWWDVRTGKSARHIEGTCTVEEATREVNRFADASTPPRAPTDDERVSCGHCQNAMISADLRQVVTSPSYHGGARIRNAASGDSVAQLVSEKLPSQYLAVSHAGTLAMADLYGTIALWKGPGHDATVIVRPDQSGPVEPRLTRNGRFLHFQFLLPERRDFVWDLFERTPLIPTSSTVEQLLAISDDGATAVVRTPDAVEFRDPRTRAVRSRLARYDGDEANASVGASGKALIVLLRPGGQDLLVCEPGGTRCPKVPIDVPPRRWMLSDDGRWVAGYSHEYALELWDAASGASVLKTGSITRQVTMSRDGSAVAWVHQPEHKPGFKVIVRRVEGAPEVHESDFGGWPTWIELSRDGSEALVLNEGGELWRWSPRTGQKTVVKEPELIAARQVRYAEDGRTLLLPRFGQVNIRLNDAAMRPLASVYSLLTGGWMVKSAAGAVEGSPDAVDSLVTRALVGSETLVFDGWLGWDAARVEGLMRQALKGVDVEPAITDAW